MRVNVAHLLKERIGSSRTYPVDDVFECLAGTGTRRVCGTVAMVRTDRGLWVTGTMGSTVVSICSRCLSQFAHHVRFNIDQEYVFVDVVCKESGGVPPVDGGMFTIDGTHSIHLGEAVRQGVITSLPMKPLCRSDCLGICQGCGINLNERQCTCKDVRSDTLWAPLTELLLGQSGPGNA